MKRITGTTIAIALLLAVPAAALASFDYPGQSPVTDARSLGAISVGLAYWRARGMTACPDGVQTFMADNLLDSDGIYALGRGGDCQAALASQPLHTVRELPDFPTTGDRRFTAQQECGEWTHEIGHALGLGHTTDGSVMDPFHRGMPAECVLWARTVFPTPDRTLSRATSRHSEPLRSRIRRVRRDVAIHQRQVRRARELR